MLRCRPSRWVESDPGRTKFLPAGRHHQLRHVLRRGGLPGELRHVLQLRADRGRGQRRYLHRRAR